MRFQTAHFVVQNRYDELTLTTSSKHYPGQMSVLSYVSRTSSSIPFASDRLFHHKHRDLRVMDNVRGDAADEHIGKTASTA